MVPTEITDNLIIPSATAISSYTNVIGDLRNGKCHIANFAVQLRSASVYEVVIISEFDQRQSKVGDTVSC